MGDIFEGAGFRLASMASASGVLNDSCHRLRASPGLPVNSSKLEPSPGLHRLKIFRPVPLASRIHISNKPYVSSASAASKSRIFASFCAYRVGGINHDNGKGSRTVYRTVGRLVQSRRRLCADPVKENCSPCRYRANYKCHRNGILRDLSRVVATPSASPHLIRPPAPDRRFDDSQRQLFRIRL
jgi:hypothetical protein